MQHLILIALFMLTAFAVQASPQSETLRAISPTPEGPNAFALAASPTGKVVGERCELSGGVWDGGPQPFVMVELVDMETGEAFSAETNFHGIYSVSVPFNGEPRAFQERVLDPYYAHATPKTLVCADLIPTTSKRSH